MKTYTAQELSNPKNADLLEEVVLLVSHSFTDDPIHMWFFDGYSRQRYIESLTYYWRTMVHLSLLCDATFKVITKDEAPPPRGVSSGSGNAPNKLGVVIPSSATIRALSIVVPPHGNATFDSMIAIARAGGLRLPWKSGSTFTWRIFRFLPSFQQMHDRMFPDHKTKYNNWHLFVLAAHPENQGQGLGKRLLLQIQEDVRQSNSTKLEEAKSAGQSFQPLPLYLEASNPRNKRLYNRVGFQDNTTLQYGQLLQGEELKIAEDGKVIGGKLYGMIWNQ